MSFLSSLWATIYHKNISKKDYGFGHQMLRIVQARAFALLCASVLGFLITKLIPNFGEQTHGIQDFLQHTTPVRMILFVAIIGPLTEELLFRSFLVPTRKNVSIFFAMWTSFLLMTLIYTLFSSELSSQANASLWIWLIKIVLFLLTLGFRYKALGLSRAQRPIAWLQSHVYGLLVVSSLAFGWIHITNFTDHAIRSMVVIITLPQTLIGFILGAIRIQGKLWHSIAVHCLYNATLVIPLAILLSSGISLDELSSQDLLKTISFGQQMVVGGVGLWVLIIVFMVLSINTYTLIERKSKK